jgi:hypothetical protein
MKKILLIWVGLAIFGISYAQEPLSAKKGVTYGAGTTSEGTLVPVSELGDKMQNDKFSGKISGKVAEVCQEKGCWMKIETSNGENIMVKFKDYKFFMPKDIVGKDVVLEGEASYKEVSVKQLKHYAKDAGKPEADIEKIKESKKELQFVAKGVLIL